MSHRGQLLSSRGTWHNLCCEFNPRLMQVLIEDISPFLTLGHCCFDFVSCVTWFSKGRTIWYLGGGGGLVFVFVACKLFFLPPVQNKFFFGDQRPTIFFYIMSKKFFEVCFPYYVRYHLVFFLVNIFFINFDNKLFFSAHIFSKLFFWFLWRQTIFLNFNLAPPPQLSNGASLNSGVNKYLVGQRWSWCRNCCMLYASRRV